MRFAKGAASKDQQCVKRCFGAKESVRQVAMVAKNGAQDNDDDVEILAVHMPKRRLVPPRLLPPDLPGGSMLPHHVIKQPITWIWAVVKNIDPFLDLCERQAPHKPWPKKGAHF